MVCVYVEVPTAQLKKCDWWEGLVHMRGVSRCCTMVLGGLCVMMAGICRMPQPSVVNWAIAELCLHLGLPSMEREVVQFGMMKCAAVAVKPASLSVPMMVLECMTVPTGKMQE